MTGCGKRVLVAIVVMKRTANLKAVMLLAHCTECDHSYHVSDELAECHVKCPECYSTVHVPKRDGPTSKRSDLSSAKLGPASSRWRIVSGSAWLWLARLTCGGAFAALMVYEWNCWPNGSPLLGPLGIIWYNGSGAESLVLCAISLAMVFAFLFKPHAITAAISLLGGLNWLFWGVVGAGIGC